MKNPELFNEDHTATYCPEDDKLRLYVGRVSREEYQALRAEGWQALHKQRETGGGDFSAVWSCDRADTALSYAGIILDEDMGPAERAADRAERFSGYLDKRLSEATGHADRYDAGPQAHGFQDKGRAVRAADRHDRIAGRAVNAWDKAEYWQSRTAGVISHALHVSSPGVRMGRIKTIEAELRRAEKVHADYCDTYRQIAGLAQDPEPFIDRLCRQYYGEDRAQAERSAAETVTGCRKIGHPRNPETPPAYVGDWMREETPEQDRVTVQEIAQWWLARNQEPKDPGEGESGNARYIRHCRLRLAYENQMIEAQGGRASGLDILPGGLFSGGLIVKVNKSPATGRVTSVQVKVARQSGYVYQVSSPAGASYSLLTIETERAAPGAYVPPTPETLAQLAALKDEGKAKRKEAKAAGKGPLPLVNLTPEEAERLQTIWNERAADRHAELKKNYRAHGDFEPAKVATITQARYSDISKGSYAKAETRELCADGQLAERFSDMYSSEREARRKARGPAVCKIRIWDGGDYHTPPRVIVISDKPGKPLPAAVWSAYVPPVSTEAKTADA